MVYVGYYSVLMILRKTTKAEEDEETEKIMVNVFVFLKIFFTSIFFHSINYFFLQSVETSVKIDTNAQKNNREQVNLWRVTLASFISFCLFVCPHCCFVLIFSIHKFSPSFFLFFIFTFCPYINSFG